MNAGLETESHAHRFSGDMPHALTDIRNLDATKFRVTYKADGSRFQLVITRLGVYLMDRNGHITLARLHFQDGAHGTIVDGEMVCDQFDTDAKPTFHVFDMWIDGKRDGSHHSRLRAAKQLLHERERAISEIPNYVPTLEPFDIKVKPTHRLCNIDKAFDDMGANNGDGLVFIPNDSNSGSATWKWKAIHTVDFLINEGRPNLGERCDLSCVELYYVPSTGSRDDPSTWVPWTSQPQSVNCDRKVSEWILESFHEADEPDSLGGVTKWVFYKVRHDKKVANALNTCITTLEAFKQSITKKDLLEAFEPA